MLGEGGGGVRGARSGGGGDRFFIEIPGGGGFPGGGWGRVAWGIFFWGGDKYYFRGRNVHQVKRQRIKSRDLKPILKAKKTP